MTGAVIKPGLAGLHPSIGGMNKVTGIGQAFRGRKVKVCLSLAVFPSLPPAR